VEKENDSDPKAKFREVLDKKKTPKSHQTKGSLRNPKIRGGSSGVGITKMFRRKSGSN